MEKILSRIRTKLIMTRLPFLGELSLRLIPKEESSVGTMATDGKYLYYSHEFVSRLPEDQLMGVLAHEIAHCVGRDVGKEGKKRRIGKNPVLWEIALEYWANHFVRDLCNLLLPGKEVRVDDIFKDTTISGAGYYYDPALKDKSKEDIYQLLFQKASKAKAFPNSVILLDNHQKLESESTIDWEMSLIQALHNAKRRGDVPAALERWVSLLEPKLPWRQLLAEAISKARDDYLYSRPNKRYIPMGIYLPSLHSETIRIVYAVDTSGSISESELREGLSEIFGICSAFASYEIHVITCDARVQGHLVITNYEWDHKNIKEICKGGGGTDFRPVFSYIKEKFLPIDIMVYFTDGEGIYPKNKPDYDVIWLIKGRPSSPPPWGRVIYFD